MTTSTPTIGPGLDGEVRIPVWNSFLPAEVKIPPGASSVIVFAHEDGGSRHSPRDQFAAKSFRDGGLGTVLFDLLTLEEQNGSTPLDPDTVDLDLIALRLMAVTLWIFGQPQFDRVRIGYHGTGSGLAAALMAAAKMGVDVTAVVSRSGRPDLAGEWLGKVQVPTLLIVGGKDGEGLQANEAAFRDLQCEKQMRIVHDASDGFDEPGMLKEASWLAGNWFGQHLNPGRVQQVH